MKTIADLAMVRHDLLNSLDRLNDPTRALERLTEFKRDIATQGIDATIKKWQKWVTEGGE